MNRTRPPDMPPADRFEHGTRARYTSGCRCDYCRIANRLYQRQRTIAVREGRGNPLVDAARAQAHLVALSEAQVGRRAVARASGVAQSLLAAVRQGKQRRIRQVTEDRILAVPLTAHAPSAVVPAQPTWERIVFLRKHGWRKVHIARALGQRGQGLQLGRDFISAKHEAQIKSLYLHTWLTVYRPVQILWRYD